MDFLIKKKELTDLVKKENLISLSKELKEIFRKIFLENSIEEEIDIFLIKNGKFSLEDACRIGLEISKIIIRPVKECLNKYQSDLIEEIISDYHIEVSDELENNLLKIIDSFILNNYSVKQLFDLLMRPQKIGGAGFNLYQAEKVSVFLKSKFEELLQNAESAFKNIEILLKEEKISLNEAVKNVIDGSQLELSQEDLQRRYENIVTTFFKGVRTEVETKIVLKRLKEIGGLELEENKAEEIITLLKNEKLRIDEKFFISTKSINQQKKNDSLKEIKFSDQTDKIIRLGTKIKKIVPQKSFLSKEKKMVLSEAPIVSPIGSSKNDLIKPARVEIEKINLEAAPLKQEEKNNIEIKSKKDNPIIDAPIQRVKEFIEEKPFIQPIAPLKQEKIEQLSFDKEENQSNLKPVLEKQKIEEPNSIPEIKKEIEPFIEIKKPIEENIFKTEETKKKEPIIQEKISIHRPDISSQPDQNIMRGINTKPRAYGPIEELNSLTLVDWRRWGNTQEAIKKIKDKINILAEESLVKKAEGIKAWKSSEINQLYLDVGAESIDQGKPILEIISQREQKNQPALTEQEFNAIVELNQELRF